MKYRYESRIKLSIGLLFCFSLFSLSAFSQMQVGSTIYGDMVQDRLGRAVGVSDDGNRIVVGLEGSDDGCSDCGQVKVFQFTNNDWELLGQEINGKVDGVGLGSSVHISGDGTTVACGGFIGAPEVVRVYRFDGQLWQQLGSDLNGDQIGDGFGLSTSMSSDGNTIIIGARYDDEVASASGKVKVSYFDGSDWVVKGQVFRGNKANDRLGRSCAMSASGDTIAFSIIGYDGFEEDLGKVESFAYVNGDWVKFGSELVGEKEKDSFGATISISENGIILAVGARSSGYAKVFELINDEWIQRGQVLTTGEEGSRYSWHLDLSPDGNLIGISDIFYNNSSGLAHIYSFEDNSWINVSGDIIGDEEGDLLGDVAVSRQGSRWILGSSRAGVNGEDSGLAIVQEMSGLNALPSYEKEIVNIYPNPTNGVINIESDQFEALRYSIFDLQGAIRMKGTLNDSKLWLENMKPGLYFLNLGETMRFPILITY